VRHTACSVESKQQNISIFLSVVRNFVILALSEPNFAEKFLRVHRLSER